MSWGPWKYAFAFAVYVAKVDWERILALYNDHKERAEKLGKSRAAKALQDCHLSRGGHQKSLWRLSCVPISLHGENL
eukprot:2834881-Amphidinium_carterae.1